MLHPEMTGKERVDFERDVDLILRDVVCQNLKMPTPQLFDQDPPGEAMQRDQEGGAVTPPLPA